MERYEITENNFIRDIRVDVIVGYIEERDGVFTAFGNNGGRVQKVGTWKRRASILPAFYRWQGW